MLTRLCRIVRFEYPLLILIRGITCVHLQFRPVFRHFKALVRYHMQQLVNLMIVFPMLIPLHSMARENHDVLAGEVNTRFVAAHLAVFAEHPILIATLLMTPVEVQRGAAGRSSPLHGAPIQALLGTTAHTPNLSAGNRVAGHEQLRINVVQIPFERFATDPLP